MFVQLFDHVPVAIYTCDQNGYITFFNKAAVKLWGRTPEIGKDLWCGSWRIFKADGSLLPLDSCPMARTLKEGIAVEGEEIIVECPDGSRKNVQVYPVPVFDDRGLLTGAINTLIDITQQRKDEGKQAMLAAIIESSSDAIISKTLDGIITSWNNSARQIFKYEEEEVIGKHISILIPPELIMEEDDIIENIRKGNRLSHFQTVRVRKDGKGIPISLTVSPIKDGKGNIIGASKIARDISRQKAAEEEIQQTSKRLAILNSIGKSISEKMDVKEILQKVTDSTTSITGAEFGAFFYNTLNAQGEALVLFTLSGAPREAFEKFGMPRNTAVFRPIFEGAGVIRVDDITKDSRYGKNLPYHGMPEGHLPVVSYLAVPVILASGAVIGGLLFGHPKPGIFKAEHEDLVVSIASQAAAALDNSRLFEEVKSLSKKKDEFIALASHELKTPLTSINGYLQILARQQKEGNGKIFVDKALEQMRKLNALVNDLLDISKMQAGKLQLFRKSFDFKKLVLEVIDALCLISDSHQIILESSPDVLYLEADRQRIEQVIVNLLTNAVKYSPDGNLVILTLETSETEMTLHIKDYGIGITEAQQKQIFTQFYRADGAAAAISGMGLGLHISKEIVERHHGRIWVESEYNKGTTFSFSLPFKAADPAL